MLGILMVIYWCLRKTYRGFGYWVLANFSVGAGFFLLILRDQIPDFLSIVIGNVLTILGLVLMYTGFQFFLGSAPFIYGIS